MRTVTRLVAAGIVAFSLHVAPAKAQEPLYLEDFSQAAVQGFGDLHNSMSRAAEWWNGRLYVATSRDFQCVQSAILKLYNPIQPYPPPDPTLTCAPNPQDLPLQAEIWRWTPGGAAGSWDRVYQSPNTVPGS